MSPGRKLEIADEPDQDIVIRLLSPGQDFVREPTWSKKTTHKGETETLEVCVLRGR